MEEKNYNHFELCILGKTHSISVVKDIIRLLGVPNYICIRVNKEYNSILVRPCEKDDPLSFRVPSKLFDRSNNVFRINSKSFVLDLFFMNGLELGKSYSFKGEYDKQRNVVIVPIIIDEKAG